MDSDNENLRLLILQLQQGGEQAFTILYDQYSKQLYRNILRLVKDEDIAQELLQDLFLKIWESRENINPEKSFKSFLYKVAENLVYGYFRKIAKENRLIAKLVISYVDFDTNAEEAMISKENHDLLKKAIANLSPQRKQIYTLCKLEGKSYEEVSNELGISTSTIRNQIVKANKAFKQYFSLNQDLVIILLTSQILRHLK
ncbi:sigma-70 family RNA polymerase sigma factor [Mucilaginibacter sp. 10I4]|uniref:RNA polymerase sigma factor n=1 Tax=Mucilaginibacter sp. 10I4 TaxID=3048580 RepID=UPI002B221D02|nr:sigma-70 family RNA polymerase sigma factor [Mucilaginibacter sp. 10I4]MEB0261815.1 sigma-70 family RNA polymerase sigma factor [Mucilaginibacter sp. 10I4]